MKNLHFHSMCKKMSGSMLPAQSRNAYMFHRLLNQRTQNILPNSSKVCPMIFRPRTATIVRKSLLLSLNRSNYLPRMLTSPELQIPNALPRTGSKLSIRDRNRNTGPNQCTLNVCLHPTVSMSHISHHTRNELKTYRHVIQSLSTMPIKLSLPILRCNTIKSIAHISSNILIPVLVQRQRATRMLNKQIEKADFVFLDLGQVFDDCVGDKVGTAGFRGEREGFLEPGHVG